MVFAKAKKKRYKRAGIDLDVIFSPFLVSQAKKKETSPGATGITSEDESKGVTEHEERGTDCKRSDRGAG